MKCLAFAVLSMLLACAVSARVVFEDNFDDNIGLDVSHPSSKWAATGAVSGTVATAGSASEVTINPMNLVYDVPYPGGFFANVIHNIAPKDLTQGVEISETGKLSVEYDMSFELFNGQAHPFGDNVTNAEDDWRLGTCVVVVLEGTNAFCTMHTNEGIWGFQEKFAYPALTGTLNPTFKGYVNGKRIATYPKGKYRKVKMVLDNANNSVSFYVQGKLVHKVTGVGQFPVGGGGRDFIVFDHTDDATNELTKFHKPSVAVACLPEIDKPDPNNLESVTGLVNYNSPDDIFKMPQNFVFGNAESATNLAKTFFGQGIKFGLRKFKVEVE